MHRPTLRQTSLGVNSSVALKHFLFTYNLTSSTDELLMMLKIRTIIVRRTNIVLDADNYNVFDLSWDQLLKEFKLY